MSSNLKVLKAGHGDSLILKFVDDDGIKRNILIDGGNKRSEYNKHLKQEILEIQNANENIDLLIITHTDQDHIKGIYYLLKDEHINKSVFKKIWFNSFRLSGNYHSSENNDISFRESCKVENLITTLKLNRNSEIYLPSLSRSSFFGLKLTLLSPFKEDIEKLKDENSKSQPHDIASYSHDYSFSIKDLIEKNSKIFIDGNEDLDTKLENRVSIAFLLEFDSNAILFLGDANPDVIVKTVEKLLLERNKKKLKVDYVKLSHHASHKSLSLELLNLLDCNKFIVSANGGKANLPNKLTVAKILSRKHRDLKVDTFIFNYKDILDEMNFSEEDFEEYRFECLSNNYKHGYKIEL